MRAYWIRTPKRARFAPFRSGSLAHLHAALLTRASKLLGDPRVDESVELIEGHEALRQARSIRQ